MKQVRRLVHKTGLLLGAMLAVSASGALFAASADAEAGAAAGVAESGASVLATGDVSGSGAGATATAGVAAAATAAAESPAAVKPIAVFVTAAPLLLINTDSSAHSAPSPIVFSLGIGADFFRNRAITFEPRLSFFTNYYLWDGEDARPAEIENRTALVLAALLDLRALKAWQRGAHRFLLGGGVGVLARYGLLANGVSSDDSGGALASDGTATSTAGDDVSDINRWLWQSARFLYPELVFSWLHALPSARASAGVEAAFYLPVGSLISGSALDAALVSLAFKLEF